MKKITLIIFLVFLSLSFTPNRNISVSGYIIPTGNEPFVKPVLEADNDEIYNLESDVMDVKLLLNEQGRKIVINGLLRKVKTNNGEIKIINVHSYE